MTHHNDASSTLLSCAFAKLKSTAGPTIVSEKAAIDVSTDPCNE